MAAKGKWYLQDEHKMKELHAIYGHKDYLLKDEYQVISLENIDKLKLEALEEQYRSLFLGKRRAKAEQWMIK